MAQVDAAEPRITGPVQVPRRLHVPQHEGELAVVDAGAVGRAGPGLATFTAFSAFAPFTAGGEHLHRGAGFSAFAAFATFATFSAFTAFTTFRDLSSLSAFTATTATQAVDRGVVGGGEQRGGRRVRLRCNRFVGRGGATAEQDAGSDADPDLGALIAHR